MGGPVERTRFDDADRERFRRRLHQDLDALRRVLARPDFGVGAATIGAEVELYLIDARSRPCPRNLEVLAAADDPRLTQELCRFNLEYNLTPVPAAGRPFTQLEQEMCSALAHANRAAAEFGARVIPVGILPTLRRTDLGPAAMTPVPRYEALTRALLRVRGERFSIRINGAEPVALDSHDVTIEGANTSLQVHLRVAPADYARTFNALQLVTPLVLAVSCNSPLLFGRRVWQETRVPLFKLAVDGRNRDSRTLHLPPRVDFGTGWVRAGVHELFAAAVHLHEPLLPVCTRENPLRRLRSGKLPELRELRLHQGTLWPWNRPVYDPSAGGHLRIELRALPAGPSAADMVANAAFAVGLAAALSERIDELLPSMPFPIATQNFYRAAQHGLGARLWWPAADGRLEHRDACELAESLLPTATRGLARLGVTRAETRHHLGTMRARLAARASGAAWQLRQLERLQPRLGRARALAQLVDRYAGLALQNQPVHLWPDLA
jgi:gamma-glutamyl:cysteine ligase YbdK (ATP-grasp superfamily)